MRRVIVLGGLGHFGRTAAEALRALAAPVHIAARRGDAELHVDANDAASIRAAFRPGDIILDAAGPFLERSTALVETAMDVGFDVIDINDDLRYAESVRELAPKIGSAGIRVLTSASSVSAVAAAVMRHSGIEHPQRLSAFLVPASRHTSNQGAALSLIRSVGRPVRVWRDGQLQERIGWTEPRTFHMPQPIGPIEGWLFESADAVHLPCIWPTLRDVAMYVDTNTFGVNTLLRFAARFPWLRKRLEGRMHLGVRFARAFGASAGGIGYEMMDASGHVARYAIVADKNSYITAVAPAVLAVHAIFQDRFPHQGLVPPDRHVEPADLFAFLQSRGIVLHRLG